MTKVLHSKQAGNLGSPSNTTVFFPGLREGLEESPQVLEPTVDEQELTSLNLKAIFFPPHLSVVAMVAEGGWLPRCVHCESTAVAGSGRAAGRWSLGFWHCESALIDQSVRDLKQ